ncbi:MAG: recombinase family protein [Streptosporangiaceae bacterium]|jgi:DNA invertase Pin-like site-specific DNA recombinase
MMRGEQKIGRSHLDRTAVIYLRQSTMMQVREHGESTARQYGLAGEAARLGWPATRIVVIDCDLGLSGRTATHREGFRDLLGRVCAGEAGAIFGLEISRLARSSADLSRLLEVARLTDTLVVDADGVYDLADINDRLLLGLKGQMSEAELHFLHSRLDGARLAAAARGDLRLPLPVGYAYDDGQVVKDPDEEVAAAITDMFAAFTATGSAYGVVTAFAGRRFPAGRAGERAWGRLSYSRVVGLLHNPVYAGAYAFGRHRTRQQVDAGGGVHARTRAVPRDQWQVLIPDHHEGYISWQDYLAIEAKMAANQSSAGARPPREGSALCQGIIYCGCGRHMGVRYHDDGRAYYSCRARSDQQATPGCQHASAATIDAAVTGALFTAIAPAELALAIAAAGEVTGRRARATRAAELAVTRASYEADRAERAFSACEPENRLVARTLEARWETRLTELADAQAALSAQLQDQAPLPGPQELRDTAASLPALWHAPTTSSKDRKRLLRTLLGDITIMPAADPAQLRIGLRWNSGTTEELLTARHYLQPRTSPAALTMARQLGPAMDNKTLAAALNDAGHRTATGRPFDIGSAGNLRTYHHISYPPPVTDGELTTAQAAARLGVSVQTIKYWIDHGYLTARRGPAGHYAIPFTPDIEAACRQRAATSFHQHKDIQTGPRRDGEHSITETAALLGVNPPRIYAWIKQGTLQARRGPGARLWITLTPQPGPPATPASPCKPSHA